MKAIASKEARRFLPILAVVALSMVLVGASRAYAYDPPTKYGEIYQAGYVDLIYACQSAGGAQSSGWADGYGRTSAINRSVMKGAMGAETRIYNYWTAAMISTTSDTTKRSYSAGEWYEVHTNYNAGGSGYFYTYTIHKVRDPITLAIEHYPTMVYFNF